MDSQRFAGHSLRVGLATQAALAGVEERIIMKQTGHKSVEIIRDEELFRNNATGRIGLWININLTQNIDRHAIIGKSA